MSVSTVECSSDGNVSNPLDAIQKHSEKMSIVQSAKVNIFERELAMCERMGQCYYCQCHLGESGSRGVGLCIDCFEKSADKGCWFCGFIDNDTVPVSDRCCPNCGFELE